MKKRDEEKFSAIYDTDLHGWGFDFRRSQLHRYKTYMKLIHKNESKFPYQSRVLEVGCGEGFFSCRYLYPKFLDITGVDVATSAVNRAKICAQHIYETDGVEIRFLADGLPTLSSVSGRFHFITMNELLNYLSKEDQKKSIERVWNLCMDEGYLMVSVNIGDPPYFTKEEITELVEAHFDVVDRADMCIKQYYDHIETRIWQLLEIVQPGFWQQPHRVNTILKKIVQAILDNRIAKKTYNPLISYLCKKILYYMPIRFIDALGRKISYDKNLSIYVLLCKKRQTRI